MEEISFLMPILLIPGIGLLLNAASTRYSAFQAEIHHLLDDGAALPVLTHAHLRARARYFRAAFVSLHLSASVFAAGSIIGALLRLMGVNAVESLTLLFTAFGILSLIWGTNALMRESLRSEEILIAHLAAIPARDA